MKNRCRIYLFVLAFTVCFTPAALAMNSGAHIYVTQQVFGSDDVDLLYGSIAPDLSLYVPDIETWNTGFEDTHYNYAILWPAGWEEDWKRFALGWMVHNEMWGADYPSHIEYPAGSEMPGYVIQKAMVLSGFIPLGDPDVRMEIAHNAIEFAIDVLIQDTMDPLLGMRLHYVNNYRSERDIQRLFNVLVAKGKVTDRETLAASEENFRGLVFMYSGALAMSSVDNMMPLAELGAALAEELYGVLLPPEQVLALLEVSVGLCAMDFEIFINDSINGIREELGLP